MKNKKYSVIIAAAGISRRMGGDVRKQYLELDGIPVLVHTARIFENIETISEIIIGTGADDISLVKKMITQYNLTKSRVITGGNTRQQTVYNALLDLSDDTDFVLVHDGVRPFTESAHILELMDVLATKNAALLAVPSKDTIKLLENHTTTTIDREKLWLAQTPQGFSYELLLTAHKKAATDHFLGTDDASLVERITGDIHFIEGSYTNIKITTQDDLDYSLFLMNKLKKEKPPEKISPSSSIVTIYTDGACSGNPGPGGYGAVLLYGDNRKEISKGFANTTNNRMELTAIIDALSVLNKPATVVLYSDSKYVVDAINLKWVYKWESNNWKRNKTDMAQNVDLWEQLLPLLATHKVEFKWVKGHANNVENERCDYLARMAVQSI